MDGKSTIFVGLHLMTLLTWIAPVFCQPQPKRFVSIDCGREADYNDTDLGIEWETDAKYISTGSNAEPPSTIVDLDVNQKQAASFRYFGEGRSRNCYVLPVKPHTTYLVRATFYPYYGLWRPPAGPWPSSFKVYLDSTLWLDINSSSTGNPPEAIIYSTRSNLSVCLVRIPEGGAPYINALELRELSPAMYPAPPQVGNSSQMSFLKLSLRENPGVPDNSVPYIRFPDDPYDRVWYGIVPPASNKVSIGRNTSIISTSDNQAKNQPPLKVMEDAWILNMHGQTGVYPSGQLGEYTIAYGYFQEVNHSAYSPSNVRVEEIKCNALSPISFSVSDQPLQVSALCLNQGPLNYITLARSRLSKMSPIVNAFEVYFVSDWNTLTTAAEDVKPVLGLQRRYNLTDWGGDPCVPVPYDWLSCSNNSGTLSSLRVTGLSLARTAMVEIPPEIINLTALTFLELRELNNLTVLDFSNNLLDGSIADFWTTINSDLVSLQEINASNNPFQNEGQFQLSSFQNLEHTNLKQANFDNSNISGTVDLSAWFNTMQDGTSIRAVLGGTLSHLQIVISFVDNNITDIYPNPDSLTKDIKALIYSAKGSYVNSGNAILLGGNPFCKPNSTSLVHQYLCRFNNSDALPNDFTGSQSRGSHEVAIATSTSVAAFAVIVLVSAIYFAAAWKWRKKRFALREIQEALAKQKVQPPFYSYADLREATQNFSSDNKLGEGGFGAVYKGDMVDGTTLAIKNLFTPRHAKQAEQAFSDFLNEVVLITSIRHKNLVQLKGCCVKEDQRFLVYEYAENGNVAEALWDEKNSKESNQHGRIELDWEKRLNICIGVARGLSYLHEALQPRIIHRDIKAANILLDKNLDAKIADFGLARPFFDEQSQANFTNTAGTLGYVAPEYVTRGELTEKADVYSFGVLVLEIVSGRKCIDSTLPGEKMFLLHLVKVLSNEGRLLDLLEPTIRANVNDDQVTRVLNIAQLCLQMDSTNRPTMSYVLSMLSGNTDIAAISPNIPIYLEPEFHDHLGANESISSSPSTD